MKILRCTPDFFDVIYQINPHMKVGEVNHDLVRKQWEALGQAYDSIGVESLLIDSQSALPDMVFCANQMLPLLNADEPTVLASNMFPEARRPEVPHFVEFFEKQSYKVLRLPEDIFLEGTGDMIYSADRKVLWGGYGFRSDDAAHRWIEANTGLDVRSLRLVSDYFYHLDVCLCVLNDDTALVYKPAFDEVSFAKLEDYYSDLIEMTEEEAMNFAGNAHCPDQKHVILQEGSPRLEQELKDRGFVPVPVDTSEFIKGGGSVFCMKLDLQ